MIHQDFFPHIHYLVDRKTAGDFGGTGGETLAFVRVSHQMVQSFGQCRNVLGRNENSVDAVSDDMSWTCGAVIADHGEASRHRLAKHIGEAFAKRGQHKQISPAHSQMRSPAESGKPHAVRDAKNGCKTPKPAEKRTLSPDFQTPAGMII